MNTLSDEVLAVQKAVVVAGSQTALAALLGVQAAQVSQWFTGTRPVPIGHCLSIERATNGVVTRAMLRPNDYWLIWPDLPAPTEPAATAVEG